MLHHPPYSPEISPCDFDLIPKVKEPQRGRRFKTIPDIIDAVGRSVRTINKTGAAKGIRRILHRWERIQHNVGEYIEGLWKYELCRCAVSKVSAALPKLKFQPSCYIILLTYFTIPWKSFFMFWYRTKFGGWIDAALYLTVYSIVVILTGRMETAAKHGVCVYRRRMEYVQQVHQLQVSITWAVCRAGVQCHRLTAINRHQMHDFLQSFLLVTVRQTSHLKEGQLCFLAYMVSVKFSFFIWCFL